VDHENEHWFVYTRTAGRITATPANWKGWLALLIGLSLTVTCGWLLMWISLDRHPILRFLALSFTILAGVFLLIRLALSKGKPTS
jgi:hypothetical protein